MKLSIERRRTPWDWRLIAWPCVALLLSLYLWARPDPHPARSEPETFQGVVQAGRIAYQCERGFERGVGIVEHCIRFIR